MTWFVCRDATGHPAISRRQISDDVVLITESYAEAVDLNNAMLSARRANHTHAAATLAEPA